MEFSENWLLDWLNITTNTTMFYDQITKSGIEVEKITKVLKIFEKVIVGEIIELLYADSEKKIVFLTVKISDKKTVFVISSNNLNFTCGLKIVIATKYSKLANNRSVNMLKFLGKISEGMVCSFKDLGILNIKNEIITICSEIPIGTDLSKFLSFGNDRIVKVSSTPNRSDGMSILGIARDILALNNMCLPTLKTYHVNVTIQDKCRIIINIPNICLGFVGRIIRNVNLNKQTPIWILERLRRSSIDSENIIVDIINYVLIELGQPIFLFNMSDVENTLIVRTANENENFVSQIGQKVLIDQHTIVISDCKKILALGNHVQSYDLKAFGQDQNIILGCAFFNPIYNTDDSMLFNFGFKNKFTEYYEKGVDPSIQKKTLNYVTYLILKLCGGKAGDITSNGLSHNYILQKKIFLSKEKLYRYVGNFISSSFVVKYLLQLGFLVENKKNCWLVISPSWRLDIKIEEDVISELVRVLGFQNIPSIELVTSWKTMYCYVNNEHILLNRAKLLLVDLGYSEVITYGFVDPILQKYLFPKKVPLYLSNPISRQMSSMRLSLWNGLLSSVLYNQNRQEKVIRFFESGLCFEGDLHEYLGVRQDLYLAGVLSGYRNEEHWKFFNRMVEFYDLKGDLELVIELLGMLDVVEFRKMCVSGLHPGQSAGIFLKNEIIGSIGVIDPIVSKKLGLKYNTIIFELVWKKIVQVRESTIQNVSEYPRSSRDISIIVDESIAVSDILQASKSISSDEIIEVRLFDVFRGKSIGLKKKSLALRFIFGSNIKTLSEKTICDLLNKCINILQLRFNAVLRDKLCNLNKN